MSKGDVIVRLKILQALDRLDNISTREAGVADLRKIISEMHPGDNHKPILKLCFNEKNRPFFQLLVPLILDLHSALSDTLSASEIETCLLLCISDRHHHFTVCNVWKQFLERRFLQPLDILRCIGNSSRSEIDSRKGLGRILVLSTEFCVKYENQDALGSLLKGILNLYFSNKYFDIAAEIFQAITLTVPVLVSDIIPNHKGLISDSIAILTRASKIQLCRPVALAFTRFLHAVAENTEDPSHISPYKDKVLKALSRDNLSLFAHTRSNPTLKNAISEATLAWKTHVSSASPVKPKEPLFTVDFDSPPRRQKPPSSIPSVRMHDSPIPETEVSFQRLEDSFIDESPMSPIKPIMSSHTLERVNPPQFTNDSIRITDESHDLPPSTASPMEYKQPNAQETFASPNNRQPSPPLPIEDVGMTFHELVTQLSPTCSVSRRTRIFDSLLKLSQRDEFADSVRATDVMTLHTFLQSQPRSPETQLLLYKFFGNTF